MAVVRIVDLATDPIVEDSQPVTKTLYVSYLASAQPHQSLPTWVYKARCGYG